MKCPYCRNDIDLAKTVLDADLRAILDLLPDFAPHSRLVLEYVGLFGVAPLAMKTGKLLRLLREIREVWRRGRFGYQKREYEIAQNDIVVALRTVCNRAFTTPLDGHNYLKKVMLTVIEQTKQTDRKRFDADQRNRETIAPRGSRKCDDPRGITFAEYRKKLEEAKKEPILTEGETL